MEAIGDQGGTLIFSILSKESRLGELSLDKFMLILNA